MAIIVHVEPAEYDNVVLSASEWPIEDSESDARTILGCLLLHQPLATGAQAPSLLFELIIPNEISLL